MISFTVQDRSVEVFPAAEPDRPLVFLNTFAGEGARVLTVLQEKKSPSFTLVTVSDLDWNRDMAPWDCPPLSEDDCPCTGGADEFLRILTQEILPEAERHIEGVPVWRGIAGYSMAGLFAVYAACQTDLFSRIASMSGSLWFPGIREFLFSHPMKARPDHLFFSLGKQECRTRNPYLKTVQENTEAIRRFYADQGIDSVFVLNPGGHYVGAEARTAAGIDWILRR